VSSIPQPAFLLYALIAVSCILLAIIIGRPSVTASREGKMLAFIAFFVLPTVCGLWGASEHFERSKQTSFCLSCHIMEPWGRSLYVDDPAHLAAAHFQNHRVPPDEACYTCHADYAMYGTIPTKLNGLHHVWVQYMGTPMQPIHLYKPFNNRECLHCHEGSRSFQDPMHVAMMDTLTSNQLSCVSSGCHDTVHKVETLKDQKFWSAQP
jgi:cytochrome c-type protein NapC